MTTAAPNPSKRHQKTQPLVFTAASAEEAVARIRSKLGSDAVVLNVRPVPANGIARLWQKPMIEVVACVPETKGEEGNPLSEALAEFRQELREIRQQVENRTPRHGVAPVPGFSESAEYFDEAGSAELNCGQWRVGRLLQKTGMIGLHAQQVIDRLRGEHGELPPETLAEEIQFAREYLAGTWRRPARDESGTLHVLVGPPGSGKTTCLCKWLTHASLIEQKLTRVWRLDGATANMAESLSVYCEILGVPAERLWQGGESSITEDMGFMDLPGVDWRRAAAVRELGAQTRQFGKAKLHLVLNGAYDTQLLLAQIRAFGQLPIDDLIITHLDEETRWGKLWNLALGTNYTIRYLSTGQNIPGDFCEATPEAIFARQLPVK